MNELIGKTIGQYQIVELIEDTGTSWKYKGFQPNMNRYVMVKVLKSLDSAAVDAFNQQNALLAQIQHPNILPIIDSGQIDGLAYRVLRYIESGVLRDHMFAYYDPRQAAGLISGVVTGLEKIHAQGYVHGNLESGNIYLDESGTPLLTDFGFPKSPNTPLTPYLSPEQTQGGIVDHRTDVYALGVLLYEMLTDETPPPGAIVSPRAKRPDLPESVEKVIFKAMAQNPDARFQRVRDFQNALSSALRPVVPVQTPIPQSASPQPIQTSTTPPPIQKKTNWAAIILGVILVIVICIGMVWIFNWLNNQNGETPVEPTSPPAEIVPTEEPEPTPEPTQEPESTQPPEEPPDVENPIEPPDGGANLPEICNSGGFAGGFFLLGSVLMIRKRSISKRKNYLTRD